jgi:hypothetical protein
MISLEIPMRSILLSALLLVSASAQTRLSADEVLLLRRVGVSDVELSAFVQRTGVLPFPERFFQTQIPAFSDELRDALSRFTPRRLELDRLAALYGEVAIGPFTTLAPETWERSVFHQGAVECAVFKDAASGARLVLAVLPTTTLPEEAAPQFVARMLNSRSGLFERSAWSLSSPLVEAMDARTWFHTDLFSEQAQAVRLEGALYASIVDSRPVFIAGESGDLKKADLDAHVRVAVRALTLISPTP